MKRLISVFLALVLIFSVAAVPAVADTETGALPFLKNIGIPMKTYIPDNSTTSFLYSRSVWDIEGYNGRIYIGGGNYNIYMTEKISTGTPVHSYTAINNRWRNEAALYEHQIARFVKTDDKLYMPAIDHSGGGGYYYSYDGVNPWQSTNTYTSAAHTFDLLVHNGVIYLGYGASYNASPKIRYSTDETNFYETYYKYNGSDVPVASGSFFRTYNIFEFGGDVYATLRIENDNSGTYDGIYKLDKTNNVLNYYSKGPADLYRGLSLAFSFDAEFNNQFVYCSSDGKLKYSSDIINFTTVNLPNNGTVTCVKVVEDELYVTAYTKKSGGGYVSNLYKTTDLTNFELVYSLDFSTFVQSFCYYDGAFYLGTSGNSRSPESTIGTVFYLNLDNPVDPEVKYDVITGEPEIEGEDDGILNVPDLGLFGNSVKYYDGKTLLNKEAVEGNTYAINFQAPAKQGYYFVGWYTDDALTQPAGGNLNLTSGVTNLYAKYVAYSPSFSLDLTNYSLNNNLVNYGYFINGVYNTGIVNKGWATKEYTSGGVKIYSTGYNSEGKDSSGNIYATNTSSWGQRTPLIITDADGTAFVPKANTKYRITIDYSYPSHGNATTQSYIDVFSGIKNSFATATSTQGEDLKTFVETKIDSVVALNAATNGTITTTTTITTGDFNEAVPVLGLYVRATGPKISETLTSFTDTSSASKQGYKVEAFSEMVISGITVTEVQETNQLKVTRLVRNEADVLAGTAQIFLPEDSSQAYRLKENFNGYAMAVFIYDANKQSYVLTENYAVNANKKDVVIPAGGFAYIISKASNGYWFNIQPSYELLTDGANLDFVNTYVVGLNAYVYGADFNIPYINTNGADVTSAQFMTNAFISLGEPVAGQTSFDPTNDDAKLFTGGASVLTPEAYEQANNEQALRVYFKYKVNADGTVTHNGENVELAERGILIKSSNQSVELTAENIDNDAITVLKSNDFTKCWDYDSTSGILTYSNHITKFVGELRQKDLVFRPYLKLENGEYVLGDEVAYNVDSVEAMASEWTADFILSGGRQLVWSNEFTNDTTIESTGFDYFRSTRDNESAVYTQDGSNIRFENGTMTIVTKPTEADDERVFSSSKLSTYGKFEYKYGYLEIRAKVPFHKGIWPAFWLQSAGKAQEYKTYFSEIDIFEVFGSLTKLKPTLHKWAPWTPDGRPHSQKNFKAYAFADNATALGWHTYGFEWTKDEMKFYVDGVCYASTSIRQEDDFDTKEVPGMDAFHDYHFIILSNGLYTAEHNTNETGFYYTKENFDEELTFTLDYIRLYQNPVTEDFKTEF